MESNYKEEGNKQKITRSIDEVNPEESTTNSTQGTKRAKGQSGDNTEADGAESKPTGAARGKKPSGDNTKADGAESKPKGAARGKKPSGDNAKADGAETLGAAQGQQHSGDNVKANEGTQIANLNSQTRPRSSPIIEIFKGILEQSIETYGEIVGTNDERYLSIQREMNLILNRPIRIGFAGKSGFGKSYIIGHLLGIRDILSRKSVKFGSDTIMPTVFKQSEAGKPKLYAQMYVLTKGRDGEYKESCDPKHSFQSNEVDEGSIGRLREYIDDMNDIFLEKFKDININTYMIIHIDAELFKEFKLEFVDFPGLLKDSDSLYLKLGANNIAIVEYWKSRGDIINVIFAGCARDANNYYLHIRDTFRFIEWCSFLSLENIVDAPAVVFVDNVAVDFDNGQNLKAVERTTSHELFKDMLRHLFKDCLASQRTPRALSSIDSLNELGLRGRTDAKEQIFNARFIDLFVTKHRIDSRPIVRRMGQLFDYFHFNSRNFTDPFREVLRRLIDNDCSTRLLFDLKRLGDNLAIRCQSLKLSIERNVFLQRNAIRRRIPMATMKQMFVDFVSSESLRQLLFIDVQGVEPQNCPLMDLYAIFRDGIMKKFLFSDTPGSYCEYFVRSLMADPDALGQYQEYEALFKQEVQQTETVIIQCLDGAFEKNNKIRLPSIGRPIKEHFITNLAAFMRCFLNDKEDASVFEKTFDYVMNHFVPAKLPQVYFDAYKKLDGANQLSEFERRAALKKLDMVRKELSRIARYQPPRTLTGDNDDNADQETYDSIRLNRPMSKQPVLTYCPNTEVKADLDFESNENVKERYELMRKYKVLRSQDNYYRDKIFYRSENSYTNAQLAPIKIDRGGHPMDRCVVVVDESSFAAKLVEVTIDSIREVFVVPNDLNINDHATRAPVFIPTFPMEERKKHYFVQEILANANLEPVGPFFIVFELPFLKAVRQQIANEIAQYKETNRRILDSTISDRISKSLYLVPVRSLEDDPSTYHHIGVGRTRDVCRLLANALSTEMFIILHDDMKFINHFYQSNYSHTRPGIALESLKFMIRVMDFERFAVCESGEVEDQISDLLYEVLENKLPSLRALGNKKFNSFLLRVIDRIISTPIILNPANVNGESMQDYVKGLDSELGLKLPDISGVAREIIDIASDVITNKSISQVAMLSTERSTHTLVSAMKRRAAGYTHGLSSVRYECVLYKREPCENIAFTGKGKFFDRQMKRNRDGFYERYASNKASMLIYDWYPAKYAISAFLNDYKKKFHAAASEDMIACFEYYFMLYLRDRQRAAPIPVSTEMDIDDDGESVDDAAGCTAAGTAAFAGDDRFDEETERIITNEFKSQFGRYESEFFEFLESAIASGYRYEDHAFNERMLLRGYSGVVVYPYILAPFGTKSASENQFDNESETGKRPREAHSDEMQICDESEIHDYSNYLNNIYQYNQCQNERRVNETESGERSMALDH